MKEEKIIRQLISKIAEYFNKKSKFKDFIEFIEFPINIQENKNNYLELFLEEISKNVNNKYLTQEIFIKNLTEYIHNLNKELFFQNSSSINTINEFLEKSIKLIEYIDADNELMFEFYKL